MVGGSGLYRLPPSFPPLGLRSTILPPIRLVLLLLLRPLLAKGTTHGGEGL